MNQPIRWDPSCSVNVAELDQQHQQLFGAVAELEQALRTGRADTVINKLLEEVIEHTISHFATEERLMEECGYPGLDAHRRDHQELSQKLTMFNLSNLAGGPGVPAALLVFLQAWLQDHILKTDKEYSGHLNHRGVH
ncbi:MAG TPA: bacteriohemerythrin [Terriglobales bacterium]|nr:bacteriohemerythrin [Terriglobales bacterium]